MKDKQLKRYRRHKRIRAKIKGTKQCPRISVFRSNKHIFVQLIDDEKGKTLVSSNDLEISRRKVGIPTQKASGKTKTEIAKEIGKEIAKKALAQKIKKAVFDRGGYQYHGRVKAVAEGAREKGLEF